MRLLDIDELNKGMQVHTISQVPIEQRMVHMSLENIEVINYLGSTLLPRTYEKVPLEKMNSTLILAPCGIPAIEADSHNISSLLVMRDMLAAKTGKDMFPSPSASSTIYNMEIRKKFDKMLNGEKTSSDSVDSIASLDDITLRDDKINILCEILDPRSLKIFGGNHRVRSLAKFVPTNAIITSYFATVATHVSMSHILHDLVIDGSVKIQLIDSSRFCSDSELSDSNNHRATLSFFDMAKRVEAEGYTLIGTQGPHGTALVNPSYKARLRSWTRGGKIIAMIPENDEGFKVRMRQVSRTTSSEILLQEEKTGLL